MEAFTPIIVEAPQLSRDWFEARLGNVTGSCVKFTRDYYVPTKKHLEAADEYYEKHPGLVSLETLEILREEYPTEYVVRAGIILQEKSTRTSYRQKLVAERISGVSMDENIFVSPAMRWGQEQEQYAKKMYSLVHKNIVEDAPLMLHPKLMCGASPDGLVIDIKTGELGNLEVKCLEPWNHLYKIIIADEMPSDYYDQVQMQMWINSRDWCDFVGYDPRVQEGLRLFVKRIERNQFFIQEVLAPSVRRFLAECDDDQRKLYAIKKRRIQEVIDITDAVQTVNLDSVSPGVEILSKKGLDIGV